MVDLVAAVDRTHVYDVQHGKDIDERCIRSI